MLATVRYSPNFRDHFKGSLHFTQGRFRLFRWLAIVILILGVVALSINAAFPRAYSSQQWPGLLGIFWIPALYFLGFPALVYWAAWRQWGSVEAFREPREIRLTDEGISIQGITFSSQFEWGHLSKVRRCGPLVLFETTARSFFMIGKSAFSSEAAFADFIAQARAQLRKARDAA